MRGEGGCILCGSVRLGERLLLRALLSGALLLLLLLYGFALLSGGRVGYVVQNHLTRLQPGDQRSGRRRRSQGLR